MNKRNTVYNISTMPNASSDTKRAQRMYRPSDSWESRAAAARRPNYALRKGVAALALAGAFGALVAGGLEGWSKTNLAWHRHERAEQNAAAFEHIKAVETGMFVIKSGANVRYSPTVDGGDDAGDAGNVYKTIPKGKVMVAIHPLVYEDGGDTWIGFTDGTAPKSLQGRKVHTVWANETQLSAQGLMDRIPGRDSSEAPSQTQTQRTMPPVTLEANGDVLNSVQVDPQAATSVMLAQAALKHFEETH